jgi:hypothetical protein
MRLDYGLFHDYDSGQELGYVSCVMRAGIGANNKWYQHRESKVVVHIKVIRDCYPQLAEEIERDISGTQHVYFWYESEYIQGRYRIV